MEAGSERLGPDLIRQHSTMQASFQNIAAGQAVDPFPITAPLPPDRILPPAQKLNYDVLSTIFVMSISGWKTTALDLSSVCHHWRYIALSMPQIWSKITLSSLTTNYALVMYLQRSKPLPLHILIWKVESDKQSWLFSSAANRIVCMRIVESWCPFFQGQFPVLERLELDLGSEAIHGLRSWDHLSNLCHFPLLQELRLISAPTVAIFDISRQQTVFAVLQTLEISCGYPLDWIGLLRSTSSTLVSLVLRLQHGSKLPLYPLYFPRLRHLQICQASDMLRRLVLDFDAPHLESIEQGFGVSTERVLIRLRSPNSVKQLGVECYPLNLNSYPALRKLWINGNIHYNYMMMQSLKRQISSCPELEAILYCAPPQRTATVDEGHSYLAPGLVFPAILDLVRETGRDITVSEFLPHELDLPGAMRRSKECSGSSCLRE